MTLEELEQARAEEQRAQDTWYAQQLYETWRKVVEEVHLWQPEAWGSMPESSEGLAIREAWLAVAVCAREMFDAPGVNPGIPGC